VDQASSSRTLLRGSGERSLEPVFAVERLADALDELKALIPANWAELGIQRDNPPDVNWGFFLLANVSGSLIFYTARLDGELIGYAPFTVAKNPMYQSRTWAWSILLWLDPRYRKLGYGRKFQWFWDADLRARGVYVVSIGVNVLVSDLMYMLKGDGYVTTTCGMDKRL
jgi:acetyltransferase (GNAT) family protein